MAVGRSRSDHRVGRRIGHALIALLLAWTFVQGLREPWRAFQYHRADPWPEQSPVLWTPSSRHVAQLRTNLDALPLDGVRTLAVVTDASLGGEAWYQYLWLAYLLPEKDLIWTPNGEPRAEADARLVLEGHTPRLEPAPGSGPEP